MKKVKSLKSSVIDVADKGIVTIAISKFDVVDGGGDIVRKGAFTKTFSEGASRIKHVIDHQLKYAAVVGLPVKMYETAEYAVVESALNLEKEISRDLFSDYKFFKDHGKTLEHSYAYQTIKAGEGKVSNTGKEISGEEILELKMFEYSTVALGMNEHTPLLDMKMEDAELLEEYLRKYDVSNKRGKEIEAIIALIKKLKEPETTPENSQPSQSLATVYKSLSTELKLF
jgi:hypothetical protein